MANTRSAAKRARQAKRRQARNQIVRSQSKTAVRSFLGELAKGNTEALKTAYIEAVRELAKAATKGAIPTRRASRKISRITLRLKKQFPDVLTAPAPAAKPKAAKAPKAS